MKKLKFEKEMRGGSLVEFHSGSYAFSIDKDIIGKKSMNEVEPFLKEFRKYKKTLVLIHKKIEEEGME